MYPLNTPGAWQRFYGRGRTPGLFPSLGAARAESLLLLFPGKNAAGQRLYRAIARQCAGVKWSAAPDMSSHSIRYDRFGSLADIIGIL